MGATTQPSELTVGVEYTYVQDIKEKLDFVLEKGGNYICSRLVPETSSEICIQTGVPVPCEEFWNDTVINSQEWTLGLVALLPNPKELESEDPVVSKRAVKAVNRQVEYCHHLGISAIMFELNQPSNHLGQILASKLNNLAQNFTFWIKVKYGSSGDCSETDWEDDSSRKWFNTFRNLCGSERKLMAVLQLNSDIPQDSSAADRWKGENVTALSVPISVFITNASGYPVLSKPHKEVLAKFLALGVHIILEVDVPTDSLDIYIKYLRYIYSHHMEFMRHPEKEYKRLGPGWENYLQSPLQPLMDNLEYSTYKTFEMDRVKYRLYEEALLLAFQKKLPAAQQREMTELVVVVAGAGRGPLVTSTFEAAKKAEVKVRVYALEKNANAEVRLHHLNKKDWGGKVTIVCTDMRSWKAPEKADFIVSELLGSFGDNELSPECLDGAQRFLKEDGIMIPQEYTSFINPVMSHSLHTDAYLKYHQSEKPDAHFETTYVCFMTRKYDIAEPKELFKFTHPTPAHGSPQAECTNDRYKRVSFKVTQDCDCHGFAGYFDSILFAANEEDKVRMSILPETYSEGMESWFPLYIPLKTGVPLKKNDILEVSFWRKSTSTKVWYEWTVTSPTTLPIHNVNGRSSFIGLDLAQSD